MSDLSINLTPALYAYMQKNSLREHEVLQALRLKTHTMSMSQMQISPEQGQFMQLLIQLMQAKIALEIGVFTGYSALSVALALPPEGHIVACDMNVEWTNIAKQYWEQANVMQKIELRLGNALNTLDHLLAEGKAGSFDFIFIDADKVNYPHYYEKSLALARSGGLIVIDNVFQGGRVADITNDEPAVRTIRKLNAELLVDKRIFLSMIPVGDGLTLAWKY